MLKFIQSEISKLQDVASNNSVETCAFGLVYPSAKIDSTSYIVHQLQPVPEDAYLSRTEYSAVLKPEYCVEISNKARSSGAGVIIAHTHPGNSPLEGFSVIDDQGEQALAQYFNRRLISTTNFTAVITANGIYARKLGQIELVPTLGLGNSLSSYSDHQLEIADLYNRQVLAFGIEGQNKISKIKVAIVGLGGTGSVVAQQLAYLGVKSFVFIDPDIVETTNLNRLVGATPNDIGLTKVSVASKQIMSINPHAKCTQLVHDITDQEVLEQYCDADFIFACTDSMASRALLNQVAYQYLIPCIDMGVGIHTNKGQIQYISGRTQMLSPGLPCLVCTDVLDAEQVRRELMTEEQRKLDPYIIGDNIPQPAVISINSLVSSAAITMFLSAVTGIPSEPRLLNYDGKRGILRPSVTDPRSHCIVCSYQGALARGNSWSLPLRSSK